MTFGARSLFETYIAICFVLREGRLELGPNLGSPTTEERANLYRAKPVIQQFEKLRALRDSGTLGESINNIDFARHEQEAQAATNSISEAWAERFRGRANYSGLSLRDLVTRFEEPELVNYYNYLYVLQSHAVHAVNASHHERFDEEEGRFVANWFPSVEAVQSSISLGCALLFGCLLELDRVYQFEGPVGTEMGQLQRAVQNLANRPIREFDLGGTG